MQIYKQGELYAAKIKFNERGVFKRSGWIWNVTLKRWVTSSVQKASEFHEFSIGEARSDIEAFLDGEGAVVVASMAADSDLFVPCPEGLAYLPFQRAGIAYAVSNKRPSNDVLIADPPGLGKCSPLNSLIRTPYGKTLMGDIKSGDDIFGSDGQIHKVTGVFPQGVKPSYKVTFWDGTSTECGLEHLWAVKDANNVKRGQDWQVQTLSWIIKWGLKHKDGRNKWQIPVPKAVPYPYKNLPIEPYLLGALLGDGTLGSSSIVFTKAECDRDIIERVKSLVPEGVHPHENCRQGETIVVHLTQPKGSIRQGGNSLLNAIKDLNLRTHGRYKFIPEIYLTASINQRLELLRGLMDTDGSCIRNRVVFHTYTERLGDDVCELVRSLGGVAVKRHYTRSDGKPDEWQINVKMDWANPFHSVRKGASWKPHNLTKHIAAVEYVGDVQQQCISVSAPNNLYLVDDFIVTHNTIQSIGISNITKKINKVLIVCPASLKVNWRREFLKWDVHGLTVGIVRTENKDKVLPDGTPMREPPARKGLKGKKIKETVDVWPDTDVLIINRELFERHNDRLKLRVWDVVIIDEADAFCNPKAKSSMHIWGAGRGRKRVMPIQGKRRIFLTGTPIPKSPINLWPFVKAMDPKGLGRNWMDFVDHYCDAYDSGFGGLDVSGSSNQQELNLKLRDSFMVRRDKQEVLTELPPKRREIVLLPDDGLLKKVENELSQARKFLAEFEKMMGIEDPEQIVNVLTKLVPKDIEDMAYEEAADLLTSNVQAGFEEFSAYRKALAIAKAPLVKEHVDRLLASGEKVILFCYHKEVAEFFKKYYNNQCAVVTGKTPTLKRQEQVDMFQEDPDCRIFIGNINAAGVGFTLTASAIVVFAELSWLPRDLEQAEDRAWRIGQLNSVLVQYLVVDGSLDARMIEVIIERMYEISMALDPKYAKH